MTGTCAAIDAIAEKRGFFLKKKEKLGRPVETKVFFFLLFSDGEERRWSFIFTL